MYEHKEEMRIKEVIFDQLVKDNPIDAPDSMVNSELKFMLEGMKFQIEQSGMKTEDSGFDEEKAKDEWRDKAEKNSKGYILLENMIKKTQIKFQKNFFMRSKMLTMLNILEILLMTKYIEHI